ncbi:MAG: class I SAM-dependent methyltransferase [Gemmatimonadota bacterium]|nr:class I SAM-dependent methyltransferase [Gemmatimonadota bacterium]
MSAWHDDDDFWSSFGGSMFDEGSWDRAPGHVDDLIALLDIEPPTRILDLCCGPGRHTVELARRGYRVTGVDRTEEFLEECRRRADAEGLDVDLAHSDMREFVAPGEFEVAVNLFTSFGYFSDDRDDRRVVDNLYESLGPGGLLLMDMGGKEVIARIFEHKQWRERDGDFYLYERTIRDGWDWIDNRWIKITTTERNEYTVGHRLYSGVELGDLVRAAGFEDVRVFGALDGRPYDTAALRLVLRARKPE